MNPSLLYNSGFTMYPLRGLLNHINIGRLRCYNGSGSTATDLQGNNNFSLIASPTYSSSNNGILTLNGTSQYLLGGSALNFTTSDFTLSAWVKFNSFTTNVAGQGPCLFFKGLYGTDGYYLQFSNGGTFFFVTSHPAAVVTSTSTVLSINTWYNITVTKIVSAVKLYVNGADVTTTAGSHGNIISSSRNFHIGNYPSFGNFFSNMVFSTLLGYNRGLSAQEVNQIFYNSKNIFAL